MRKKQSTIQRLFRRNPNGGEEEDVDLKRKKQDKKPAFQAASFLELLRYAEKVDYCLLAGGVLGSVVAGVCAPLTAIIMIDMNNVMIRAQSLLGEDPDFDMAGFKSDVFSVVIRIATNGLVMLLAAYFSMLCFYGLCERQIHRIRKHFLYAVMHQDMEWFDVNQVGALTQKMSGGIDRIKDGMSDKVGVVLHSVVSLVIGVTMAFLINWKMTLIVLVVAPCITISLFFNARALRKAIRIEMTAYGAAASIATEVISGIRTVVSFCAQSFEIDRYTATLKTARKLGIRKAVVTGLCTGMFTFFMNFAIGVGFYFGATLVFSGEMEPGAVFGVFWAVMLGCMRLGQAIPNMNAILSAKMAAGEIFSIIDKKPKVDCSTDAGVKLSSVRGDISFRDVHFSYPTRPTVKVLNGVSFDVKAGSKVALVGPSGCGKSTTVGLLMRFYTALQGSVTLDTPIEDLNVKWLRETLGLVSQDPVLFAATVEDNLRMGDDLPLRVLEDACRTANALDFIQKLPNGFQTLVGEGGIKLSGGQRQRLSIARALVRNPKVLLLDEATSALDSESETLVQAALDMAAEGRTTLSIAHRLSTVMNADVILVFDKGSIVEQGDHETLMKKDGVYAGLVAAQQIDSERKDETDDEYESADDGGLFERGVVRGSRDLLDVRESARKARASERLSKSLTNVESIDVEVADVAEEVHQQDAAKASLMDILRYAKPEWKYLTFGLMSTIITGSRFPLFSLLCGQLFYALGMDASEGMARALLVSIGFLVLGVVAGLTCFAAGVLFGFSGETMASRLRIATFKNILRQDGYYHDMPSHSVGKLTTRLATDAHNVQAAVDQRLSEVLQGFTALIGGFIVAFATSAIIAPVCLVSSLSLVVVQLSISNFLKRRGFTDVKLAESASKIANESIENIRAVQALARQKTLYAAFCAASHVPHKRALFRGFFQSFIYALGISFSCINFAISYSLGVLLISGGYTQPAKLYQVIESLNIASIIIIAASNYFPEYLKARLSAGLMFQIMNEEPRVNAMGEGGLKPSVVEGSVSLQKVAFAYPNSKKQLILNQLSFTAPAGKTVALVGPSGCGKSTVVQLLERFYDAVGGHVLIDKFDVKQLNINWLRNLSAVVGQEPTLFNLSIRDNITYGLPPGVSDQKVVDAAKLANVHSFIDSLPDKYATNIGSKGTQLSGGQRQRIAIARAIIRDPKILLLDEATSALDTESEKIVQEALDRARAGRTCVVIAHRLSTIQHADLIVVIREGKVHELGDHQQLLSKKGLYYNMVMKQHMV